MKGKVVYRGVEYKNLTDLANKMGVSQWTIRTRLSRGDSLGEAVEGGGKRVEFEGKRYRSILEICNTFGLEYGAVTMRIRRGWSFQEDIRGKRKK